MSHEQLYIFDTTLRDGEQSPGCTMTEREKCRVAAALDDLGVDIIEAGFPASSPEESAAVAAICEQVEHARIAALARCTVNDIEAAWQAIRSANKSRLHVFLGTSPIHRTAKLQMDTDDVIARVRNGVTHARTLCDDVEFSPEDATRTEPTFLCDVIANAVECGATTINIPDTVGYATPDEYAGLIRQVREWINDDRIIVSAHCHDDLGLAIANSVAAVHAGARQVECTINGIGERAGNCALEELVMVVRTRQDAFPVKTGVRSELLYPVSRAVAAATGSRVPRNKAIVGDNAFAHEAGIHQHGMLQDRATYEIMNPRDVGQRDSTLVLGKHSGRHAFRKRIESLGIRASDLEIDQGLRAFKSLAQRKRHIYDADIQVIMNDAADPAFLPWSMQWMHVGTGTGGPATATVRLAHLCDGEFEEAAVGDGPIDAVFKAIARAMNQPIELAHFEVESVSFGEDALGVVNVEVRNGNELRRGQGVSTDIVDAGAHAMINAVNRFRGTAPLDHEEIADATH